MEESRGSGCCPPMDLMRQLLQLIVLVQSAHLTVSYLWDLGLVQFKDLNSEKSPFQRTDAVQIAERWLGVLAKEMLEKEYIVDLDDVEVKLGEIEAELVKINANNDKLQRSYNELMEYKLVLEKAGEFFLT